MEHSATGTATAGEGIAPSPSVTEAPIRIVTFNVNGLRAVLQRLYGPTGTISKFLDDVGSKADILCLQETKLRRNELTAAAHQLASAEGWDSFFSCSNSSRGYSGTATFCRTDKTLPFAAELGFSGLLNNDDTFTPAAAVDPSSSSSSSSSSPFPTVHQELLAGFSIEELRNLDSEGRVVITDHGSFVLFNIYAPAVTKEDPEQAKARLAFKMRFYTALQRRWEALLAAGRAVIVVGDMNIAPAPLDYPDFDPEFYRSSRPDRLWLRALLSGNNNNNSSDGDGAPGAIGGAIGSGNVVVSNFNTNTNRDKATVPLFTDCFRAFYPGRKNAFTVWSTATGARINNYGSRIDLTLSAGLYVGKEAPIGRYLHQETDGIDHSSFGEINAGTDTMLPPPPPPLSEIDSQQGQQEQQQQRQQHQIVNRDVWISAADIEPTIQGSDHCPAWLEVKLNPNNKFSRINEAGKVDMARVKSSPCAQTPPPCAMRFCGKQTKLHSWLAMGKTTSNKTTMKDVVTEKEESEAAGAGAVAVARQKPPPQLQNAATAAAVVPPATGSGIGAIKPKQMSLKAFMKAPPSTNTITASKTQEKGLEQSPTAAAPQMLEPIAATTNNAPATTAPAPATTSFLQAELQAAAKHQEKQLFAAKGAWQAIQQRMQAPTCLHGDLAALKKVNKSGPNQGQYFYMCARGKGQGPNAQCSFFKWVEKKAGDAPRTTMNNAVTNNKNNKESGGGREEGSAKRFKN